MSATVPDLNELANWLNAKLFVTEFRPVQLLELVKVRDQLFKVEGDARCGTETEGTHGLRLTLHRTLPAPVLLYIFYNIFLDSCILFRYQCSL